MKRTLLWLCTVCLLALGVMGCVRHPLTDTEFRGFCYTDIGRWTSCDTFTICDDFDNNVLSVKHASRADCARGCQEAYNRQYGPNLFEGCAPTVLDAYNWCMKYCNTNYEN